MRTAKLAATVHLVGGLLLTMAVNVPMNEELADVAVPTTVEQAERVWSDYSVPWQRWNLVRTVASTGALVLAVAAVGRLWAAGTACHRGAASPSVAAPGSSVC